MSSLSNRFKAGVTISSLFLLLAMRLSAQASSRKTAEALIPSSALPLLMPALKQARPVGSLRDPFGVVETAGVRLAGQAGQDRLTVVETRLRDIFSKALQSVIHAKESKGSLIMFDGKTFHVGEELFVGASLSPRPLLEKTRVVLAKISADSIELSVHSVDEHHHEETVKLPLERQFVE
jgi:hypothetical protein